MPLFLVTPCLLVIAQPCMEWLLIFFLKNYPLVNCCLKLDKHSVHCKLCCKEFKINRVEISHINAHAKGKAHENNAKSKKGQRTFTISSNLSLSKSSTSIKNIHTIKITLNLETVHTRFLGNFFLIYCFFVTSSFKSQIFQWTQAKFSSHPYKGFRRIFNS